MINWVHRPRVPRITSLPIRITGGNSSMYLRTMPTALPKVWSAVQTAIVALITAMEMGIALSNYIHVTLATGILREDFDQFFIVC